MKCKPRLLRSTTWPVVARMARDGQVQHSHAELPLTETKTQGVPERPDLLQSCVRRDYPELPGVLDARKSATLTRHYYPEGGWGWVVVTCSVLVHILGHGLQLSFVQLISPMQAKFGVHNIGHIGWLGALSVATSLFLSPVTVAWCRRKSTRVTAVLGGLVTALGCLFTSFAAQFHQLFFSYVIVFGVGVSMTRDTSTLMIAQYFKRRRELVEIFIVSASGLGLAVMSTFVHSVVSAIGWRLGLQAVTVTVFLMFFLGTFYRSATLYHPQRRAILHLKYQKRKIKDKNKVEEKIPFLDLSTLRSKTLRILLVSTSLTAFGLFTPIFYLAHQVEGMNIALQASLGLAWVLGCCGCGMLVIRQSAECNVARQYLCQACALVCGVAILALTAVQGVAGHLILVWVYGAFCGGYQYALKTFVLERVRARNFSRAWSFVQCSQALPIALGVPLAGYISSIAWCGRAGYYLSSACVLLGGVSMSLIDMHRRHLRHKLKQGSCHSSSHTSLEHKAIHSLHCNAQNLCSCEARLACSVSAPAAAAAAAASTLLGNGFHRSLTLANMGRAELKKLTSISEDLELPEQLVTECGGECITSCTKVENFLVLSEFENNVRAGSDLSERRRWSISPTRKPSVKFDTGSRTLPRVTRVSGQFIAPEICIQPPEETEPIPVKIISTQCSHMNENNVINNEKQKNTHIKERICKIPAYVNSNWRIISVANNKRPITVIDEASV